MAKECLFCKMLSGEVPCEKIYEDDKVFGFKDIYPQAEIHYLFIHKNHSKDFLEMPEDEIASVFSGIKYVVKKEGHQASGVRVVTNLGHYGCQTIFHTHFHLLGGEQLGRFGR